MKKIFVSTPMTVMSNESFAVFRENVLDVIEYLKASIKNSFIYYAGIRGKGATDFADPETAYRNDIAAIKDSDLFILIYPEQSSTSALIELGYALGISLAVVIVVPERNTLPYMIREIDKVTHNALVLEYGKKYDFLRTIEINKVAIEELVK